jgi:hypothetical protein
VSALLRIGVDDALAIVARYCGKTSETYRYVAHDVTELAKAVATIEGLATPPAGAGEAVAWMLRWTGVFTEEGKSHFYTDKKAADRMAETVRDSYGCPDVEVTPLYAAPTPLPEAVRELVARWRARANDHELNVQARAATDCCAAELDAATPPEGAAQGREDARDAARMAWLDNADNAAEIGIYGCLGHDLSLRERIDVAMQHDAALATQPTPAGGGA